MHTYMYDWGEPERAPLCRVVDCGRGSMHVCTVCTYCKYVILNISQLDYVIICMHASTKQGLWMGYPGRLGESVHRAIGEDCWETKASTREREREWRACT